MTPRRTLAAISAAAGLAWLGMYLHNIADLPGLTWSSPENAGPGLVWIALVAAWWIVPGEAWPRAMLLGWEWLNLVGGFVTVLPLSVLPFRPEQTLRHYAFHVLYAAALVPVLILTHRARNR